MFYEDHEKLVYTPTGADPDKVRYDPLQLLNVLVVETEGNLYEWLEDRNGPSADAADPTSLRGMDAGDVSPAGKKQKLVAAARAEVQLAHCARRAFGLLVRYQDPNTGETVTAPDPQYLDAHVLEWLMDFMEWLEKKGQRAAP